MYRLDKEPLQKGQEGNRISEPEWRTVGAELCTVIRKSITIEVSAFYDQVGRFSSRQPRALSQRLQAIIRN